MADPDLPVSVQAFEMIDKLDVGILQTLSEDELRPILPILVRMALVIPFDTSPEWAEKNRSILTKLLTTDNTNGIVSLLTADFHALEADLKKEIVLRSTTPASDNSFLGFASQSLASDFERHDSSRRFRLVLSELLSIQSFARSSIVQTSFAVSELFDNDIYIDEVSDVLVILTAELTASIQLSEVAETLLRIKRGPDMICRLVANFPEKFLDVCTALIMNGHKLDEDSIVARNRIKTLRLLCQMNPSKALVVRSVAVDNCRMPGLAVLITVDYDCTSDSHSSHGDTELMNFLSGFFKHPDETIKTWFIQYLKSGQKKMEQGQPSTLQYLRQELLSLLRKFMKTTKGSSLEDEKMVKISDLIKLYCGLCGCGNIKFTEEENNALLGLVCFFPPVTEEGIKMVMLCLCLLITCPSLISSIEAEKRAIEWLKTLVREEKYFSQTSNIRSSFEEMLLLIAIHFHSGQYSAISDLVCSTLGLKVQVRGSNLGKMKQLFTHQVFTEETVTSQAVKVPVTTNLSEKVDGFLPIHCILQLLKSRAFSKHQVCIKEWIMKQINQAEKPLHHLLPPLIEAFVHSILVPVTRGGHTNEAICLEDIKKIFKFKLYSLENDENDDDKPVCILTSQLLMLYYLMIFHDTYLTQTKNGAQLHNPYGLDWMTQVPIFFLLQQARKQDEDYSHLFPGILKLTVIHHPHLCLVSNWTDIPEDRSEEVSLIELNDLFKVLQEGFASLPSSEEKVYHTLIKMYKLSNRCLWSLAPNFVSNLPLLLRDGVSKKIREGYKKIWYRLNSVFPDCLWVMTVNALRPKNAISEKLSWRTIIHDPLHVLRCDFKVFRCREVLEILLRILTAFLAASRNHLQEHLMEKPSRSQEEEKDREELRLALIAGQESAAVQILLEFCLPVASDVASETSPKEVQGLICTHLHHTFISDPSLAKLVHFQTYSSDLLPLTVETVPSMHICLDFIPELLAQPDLEKQVFAIQLASFLCLQFKIAKSLCVAKLCFNVANTMISLLPSARRSVFFTPVLPALVRMCQAFPPLADDARLLLLQLRSISLSTLAATSCTFISSDALTMAFSKARTKFPDKKSFENFQSNLSPEEGLFLAIQESLETLEDNKQRTNCV